TVPFINLNLNSVQFQFTRNNNFQKDSSAQANLFSQTANDVFSVVLPYDVDKGAQGNFRVQVTKGNQFAQGVNTLTEDDQFSLEFNQKLLQNQTLHIPFTHLKLKLDEPLEARLVLTTEFVNNQSIYSPDQLRTQRYNGTLSVNYNALKNLRVGLGFTYEHLDNNLIQTLGYDLIQATISGEARF
ncbi:MAG TPA: hypothetical protein VMU88_05245, partial [bacterium]|nr:hypothetical protein [bacterium]